MAMTNRLFNANPAPEPEATVEEKEPIQFPTPAPDEGINQALRNVTINASDLGFTTLGFLLAFQFSSDSEVRQEDLPAMEQAVGLDVLEKRRKKSSAVYAALKKASRISKKEKDGPEIVVTLVYEGPDEVIFRIIDQKLDEAKRDVEWEKTNRVRYIKASDEILFEMPTDLENQVKHLFLHRLEYYDREDLYDICRRYVMESMSAVQVGLGLFFVTQQFGEMSQNLRDLVEGRKAIVNGEEVFVTRGIPSAGMTRLPVTDSENAKKDMYKTFVSQIMSDIANLDRDITVIENDKERGVREKSYIERINRMRATTEIYASAMEANAGDMIERITKVHKRFVRVLANRAAND